MSPSPRTASAPRATGFAKPRAATKTNRLSDSKRSVAEAPPAPRAIAVKLGPLLSPYKKRGRLSLRIERLPQLARLSAGRNNGDNSWSLSLDELEDLTYTPPPGMVETHSLAVRIIGLDGGGSTLAVLEFPVSPDEPEIGTGDAGFAAQDDAAGPGDLTQLGLLRDELTEVKATLAERESDLAKARQKAEQSRPASQADESKFTSLSAGLLVRKGEAGPSKLAPEGDEIALRHLREELAGTRASLANREAALAEARLALEMAREREQHESAAALSKAKMAWASDEAARLAAAQAQWQEASTKALAEARLAVEQARERGQKESDAALSKAKMAWTSEEAARLAAAQAQWEEKSKKALAEARIRAEAEARLAVEQARERNQHESEAALSKAKAAWISEEAARLAAVQARDSAHASEQRRLREELAATQASLSNRETALAEARLAVEQARERAQQESEAALSKAEKVWKADEAARLVAAQAQWQQTSTRALSEARAQAGTVQDSGNATELRRLRDELATMQASLSNRETALAEARSAVEQARERGLQESEAALSKAKIAWKAEEAARLAAAEHIWQQKSGKILAEASQRLEAAEAALKEPRVRAETAHESGNAIELSRLRQELAATQARLGNRESALAEAHLALEQARERGPESDAALSKVELAWKADEAARLAAAQAQWEEKSAIALAEATQRLEAAEAALKQARVRAETPHDSGNAIELRRLHQELAATQANLAYRERELAEARLTLQQADELPETKIVLTPDRMGNAVGRLEPQMDRPAKSHLMRDMVVVGALVVSAIVFYPRIEAFFPQIGTIFGDALAPAGVPQPASPKIAERPLTLVIHGANVRSGPSSTADVVSTLQRGASVVTLEQRGSWTLVRIPGESGKTEPQQGWVFSSFLEGAGAIK